MKTIDQPLQPLLVAAASIAIATVIGCGKSTTTDHNDTSPAVAEPAHAHPTEGPHHGSLIELGNEEYHAELVHDEAAGTVTIYLLDSAAQKATPVDATEVIINLSHDGQAEQFTLAASPDQGDPAGKSSRFVSSEAELAEELDHDHAEAQLVVTIDGKQFRGAVAHEHDHDEHEHEEMDHN